MNVPVTNASEMNVSVKISAPVNPTEMQEKVEKAISNFFPVELKLQVSEIPDIVWRGRS